METDDPRAALADRKVAVRAAAARDLATVGTWDDLVRLVERGWNDPSAAVRLHAAAAASDWVGRRRGAHAQEALDAEQRAQVLRWALANDPGRNPSMLMLLAAASPEDALVRLARVVRDPRSDVRLGVVTAVRRMVLSAVGDRERVEASVREWLADERLALDTRGELVKIVGEAGLSGLRDALVAVRRVGGDLLVLADKALDRLDARTRPETWAGPWVSDGRDVFELSDAREDRLGLLGPEAWVDDGGTRPFVLADGAARLGGEPAHLVWATPLGSVEPRLALQWGGRTWWRPDPAEAASRIEAEVPRLRAWGPAAAAALAAWSPTLSPLVGERVAAVASWLSGDLDDAAARLDALLDRKKPPVELHLWRAHVASERGEREVAAAQVAAFLEKAPKGSGLRADAEALQRSL